jgi:hypothetical protein
VEVNGATAQVAFNETSVTNNQVFGVHATDSGIARMANSDVTNNNGTGLLAETSAQILSFGNTYVAGNNPDGSKTGTISAQ